MTKKQHEISPVPPVPEDLDAGGQALWRALSEEHLELTAAQVVQLEEACRAKDRLDKLHRLLRGEPYAWARVRVGDGVAELKVDAALATANSTANLLKQLLAALRLPDPQTGRTPQYRGPRGAQAPTVPGGAPPKVSSLEKARRASLGRSG